MLGDSIKKARNKNSGRRRDNGTVVKDSVTQQSDLEQFLSVSELAGTSFAAEKSRLVGSTQVEESSANPQEINKGDESREWLCIPRRPKFPPNVTASDLKRMEESSFLEWRRGLAAKEDSGVFIITPFERNLEVWRHLWRVVEACDTIVQILDARNPLLFYSPDLFKYCAELDERKKCILLMNKCDYLTPQQITIWKEYFDSINIPVLFYSAYSALEEKTEENVLTREGLLSFLNSTSNGGKVGLIGYPNVGKSSTINSLMNSKKVSVSSTPGKTKHFQTLKVPDTQFTIFDCPGLVLPNFASSAADLVLNGILPVDQLREWDSAVTLLLSRIPLSILANIYGLCLEEGLNSHEFLATFAISRGFRTSFHGNADESRAARIVLKDYVKGKLLYCHAAPSADSKEYENLTFEKMNTMFPPKKIIHTFQPNRVADVPLEEEITGFTISSVNGFRNAPKPVFRSDKKHFKGKKARD